MKRFSAKAIVSLALIVMLLASLCAPAFAATTVLSTQNLVVNEQEVDCEKYNIDGSNYFKLRDLAKLMNGTTSQFSVGYDDATKTVTITTGEAYTPDGSELIVGADKSASAQPRVSMIYSCFPANSGPVTKIILQSPVRFFVYDHFRAGFLPVKSVKVYFIVFPDFSVHPADRRPPPQQDPLWRPVFY